MIVEAESVPERAIEGDVSRGNRRVRKPEN